MSLHPAHATASRSQRLQQLFKWTVYTLLFVNFGFYVVEDLTQSMHTLHAGSSFLDMTSSFATSMAVLAWFMLLASLELETYAIDDSAWTRRIELMAHGARVIAFLVIAHFVFALLDWAIELQTDRSMAGISSPCEVVDQDLSWSFNLDYVELTADNCATLTTDTRLHQLGKDPVVTDEAGLNLSRQLAWGDVLEIFSWLIIILAMEVMVRLQGRGVTEGRLMSLLRGTKYIFYSVLFCLGFWWASLGHWLYLWDTFLWIAGFSAIEMNLRLWREEIRLQNRNPGETNPAGATTVSAP